MRRVIWANASAYLSILVSDILTLIYGKLEYWSKKRVLEEKYEDKSDNIDIGNMDYNLWQTWPLVLEKDPVSKYTDQSANIDIRYLD